VRILFIVALSISPAPTMPEAEHPICPDVTAWKPLAERSTE
jgi:hypothetical protein